MGRHQVFILAEAETLAQGEASSEAANALLKLLEEPPESTVLILTSGEPGRLLPTIRSRTTPLQLPPLKDEEVAEFLMQVKKLDAGTAKQVAGLSQGSIGRGLRLLSDGDGDGPLTQIRTRAFKLIRAALAPAPLDVFQVSLTFKSTGARGLMDLLESLEECLRDLALAASGIGAAWMDPATERFFGDVLQRWKIHPSRVAGAVQLVDEARTLASGNVNPQLVIFDLLMELRKALLPEAEPAAVER
jgi:DNA polymerase-3 subunit delta'